MDNDHPYHVADVVPSTHSSPPLLACALRSGSNQSLQRPCSRWSFQSAASGEAAVVVLGGNSGGALRLSASVELTAPAGGAIAEFVAAVSAVNGELLWGRALEPNAAGDAPAIVAAPHIIAGARADVVVCATSAGAIPVALVARGVDVVSTAADTPAPGGQPESETATWALGTEYADLRRARLVAPPLEVVFTMP